MLYLYIICVLCLLILLSGRKRGRPRKQPRDSNASSPLPKLKLKPATPPLMSEKENSAAEGLLGLSEVGESGFIIRDGFVGKTYLQVFSPFSLKMKNSGHDPESSYLQKKMIV